jgi:N6-adenosine-specific RNA methylase IME4
MAPEPKRLKRYPTLLLDEIKEIPVHLVANKDAHLYLWVPNALLNEGLEVMEAWGFKYKSNIICHKVRKEGMAVELGFTFVTQQRLYFLEPGAI